MCDQFRCAGLHGDLLMCFVFQHFIGQVVSVESTDAPGPAGVKLTLARAAIKTAGQDVDGPTTQDREYFSTVSVKD